MPPDRAGHLGRYRPDFAHLYTITTFNPYSHQQNERQSHFDPALCSFLIRDVSTSQVFTPRFQLIMNISESNEQTSSYGSINGRECATLSSKRYFDYEMRFPECTNMTPPKGFKNPPLEAYVLKSQESQLDKTKTESCGSCLC
jgi:hypothetical protein